MNSILRVMCLAIAFQFFPNPGNSTSPENFVSGLIWPIGSYGGVLFYEEIVLNDFDSDYYGVRSNYAEDFVVEVAVHRDFVVGGGKIVTEFKFNHQESAGKNLTRLWYLGEGEGTEFWGYAVVRRDPNKFELLDRDLRVALVRVSSFLFCSSDDRSVNCAKISPYND